MKKNILSIIVCTAFFCLFSGCQVEGPGGYTIEIQVSPEEAAGGIYIDPVKQYYSLGDIVMLIALNYNIYQFQYWMNENNDMSEYDILVVFVEDNRSFYAFYELNCIRIIDSEGDVGLYTSLAVDGSNIYISYCNDENGDLKLTRSLDSGCNWFAGDIKIITSLGRYGVRYTSLAVDGSNIYISYYDWMNSDLKFAKSIDSGNTWLPGNIRTIDYTGGRYSSLAVDWSNIYISYYDYDNEHLKFAKSVDGGNTWLPGDIRIVDSVGWNGGYTSLEVVGSNIYISYYDSINGELKFAKSTDGGNTWPAGNIEIVDSSGVVRFYTSLAVDGANIYISYYDYDNEHLKFAKSVDGGNTWLPGDIRIVDSTGGEYTSLAIDGSNIYISYYAYSNLKFAKSIDSGNTWLPGDIRTVDPTGYVGKYNSLAVDGSNIYISYYDSTNGDLKFARSLDGGNTWYNGD